MINWLDPILLVLKPLDLLIRLTEVNRIWR
jgi:hypothetical protein